MPNYVRKKVYGGYYFFTVVTYKRRKLLTSDPARLILKEAFRRVQTTMPFKTHAFCLMPDHLHCIWQLPRQSCDYSKRWSVIKRLFTQAYLADGGCEWTQTDSRRHKRQRGVWQKRFWEHFIRDRDDYCNHLHYIHYNPVKHGLCQHPQQWAFSTYYKYRQQKMYDGFDWSCFTLDDFHDMIEFNE